MLFINFTPKKKVEVRKHPIIVHTHVQAISDPKARTLSPREQFPRKKYKKLFASSSGSLPEHRREIPPSRSTSVPHFPLVKYESPPVHVPQPIEMLHIDTPLEGTGDVSYLCLMIQTLRQQLKLPSEGEVKIAMTVLKSGYVEKIRILYAESEENRCYLERALTSLCLPPLSGEFCNTSQHTFTLTFRHEE